MKQEKEVKNQKQEVSPSKKKGKQSTKQEIFLHLLQLYEPNPKATQSNQVFHEIQDLYQLVSQHPKSRNSKILKKIKAELTQLRCFKNPPYNQQNPQFLQIFKRDNNNIINMISSFVQMTKYKKGQIVEVTAMKRRSIKILLHGQICGFEPINYKTFKNCMQKIKNNEINLNILYNSHILLTQLLEISKRQNPEQNSSVAKNQDNNKVQNVADIKKTNVTEQNIGQFLDQASTQLKFIGEVLTKSQCRQILTRCNIISPLAPHKDSKKINIGQFVVDKDQPMFVDQKPEYYCSVVCCTDCTFLQIGFEIAKQVINLINSDRQRPFIQSLLFKFPLLKYFEAKQYVTQDFMIMQEAEQQEGVKPVRKAIQVIKQLKVVNSLNFQLMYTGQIYLIISGNVTLVINQVSEKKPSTLDEYIVSQKNITNKQILQLYKNDIFGFEEIGKNKSANLRYLVSIGSKLLKINQNVLRVHKQMLPGFSEQLNGLFEVRNQLIVQILRKMEYNLQMQEVNRHGSITFTKQQIRLAQLKPSKSTQLTSIEKQIGQLKYLGHQHYGDVSKRVKQHFSPHRQNRPKQSLSPQIVQQSGLGLEFAKNLLKKPSQKSQKININNGWIQIRGPKGELLRKKRVKQTDCQELQDGKGDALLRRLGILNSRQIADHNFEMVTKRPSKYQFQDLKKQANQFKSIREKSQSLPRLKKFFAKKQDRLFTILYKRTHL